MKQFYVLIISMVLTSLVNAQPVYDNCQDALGLCPDLFLNATNIDATTDVCPGCSDGATSAGNFCFELNNSVWFSFSTNGVGGNAQVLISNINCLVAPGKDDQIQAVVIDAVVPCDETTYSAVSNCFTGINVDFALNATGLSPNTTYYVLVDGDINGSTEPAECDFDIQVTGPAVDVNITTSSSPENCGFGDGQIDITGLSGGTAPYQYSIGGAYQGNTTFINLSAGNYQMLARDANGCVFDIGAVNVGVSGGPTGGIAVPTGANCINDGEIQVAAVSGGNPPYSYALNGGSPQASNIFSGLSAGVYSIVVSDNTGCNQHLTNVVVPENGGPGGGIVSSTDPVCGGSDGIIDLAVSGGTTPYTFSLNGGTPQSSGSFTGLPAGTYSISVTDQNGCTYVHNGITINNQPPQTVPTAVLSSSPDPACVGDVITFTVAASDAGTAPNYNFFQNGVSVQSGASNSYSAALADGDVVYCMVTVDNLCSAISSVLTNAVNITVVPNETAVVTIVTGSTTVCESELVGVLANASGCSGGYVYDWKINGVTVQAGADSILNTADLQDGDVVTCDVSCNSPCGSATTSNGLMFDVTPISVYAGEDTLILQGASVTLNGSGTGILVWTPSTALTDPTIANPVANPEVTTVYVLTATNNGCVLSDSVIVYVTPPIIIPNTFTPNGDGTNDTWQIERIDNFSNCNVRVFDRWGQQVFNSTGYSNQQGWDGTRIGAFLPAATYYYIIDLNTGDDDLDIHTGSITIVY